MTNRISLKNIKINNAMSQETACYSATVYFDGKKVGTTLNRGTGGCDLFTPTDSDLAAEMYAYITTLPPYEYCGYTLSTDLDTVCADLLDQYESGGAA